MGKYDGLDEKIIETINAIEPAQFYELMQYLHPLIGFHSESGGEVFRTLDRRLQVLRKKGLIVFMKGWRLAPAAKK